MLRQKSHRDGGTREPDAHHGRPARKKRRPGLMPGLAEIAVAPLRRRRYFCGGAAGVSCGGADGVGSVGIFIS